MIPGKGIFMQYRTIDMAAYPRRDHFTYFSGLAYPYVGVTVNVDVTDLLAKIKGEGLPFFLTVCWCAAQAANRVPEFRQRIVDGGIIEFERCRVSHTVALEDGTFCFCVLEDAPGFATCGRAGRPRRRPSGAPASRRTRRRRWTNSLSRPSPGSPIPRWSSRCPVRRTATPASPGEGTSPRRGGPCCRSPCCATTLWWTASTCPTFIKTWTKRSKK